MVILEFIAHKKHTLPRYLRENIRIYRHRGTPTSLPLLSRVFQWRINFIIGAQITLALIKFLTVHYQYTRERERGYSLENRFVGISPTYNFRFGHLCLRMWWITTCWKFRPTCPKWSDLKQRTWVVISFERVLHNYWCKILSRIRIIKTISRYLTYVIVPSKR